MHVFPSIELDISTHWQSETLGTMSVCDLNRV